MTLRVRMAGLDDTLAISGLFRAPIRVWQRLDAAGRVENVPYERLTLFQRWQHGGAFGPWMSLETGAIWLNHLLLEAGLPLLAVTEEGRIVGYAEAFINNEPAPFGMHVHLAVMVTQVGTDDDTPVALLGALMERARRMGCGAVTLNRVSFDSTDPALAAAEPYSPTVVETVRRYTLPARTGQIFYRAVEHLDADPLQISGWAMPIGRATSARHQWETLWPRLWTTLPERKARAEHRLRLSVSGMDAFVHVQQGMYDPRAADVAVWTPQTVTPQIITSLRDWAHREGYRTLSLIASENAAKAAFGAGAETDAYQQQTIGIPVG